MTRVVPRSAAGRRRLLTLVLTVVLLLMLLPYVWLVLTGGGPGSASEVLDLFTYRVRS